MAIINCPGCGRRISDKSKFCTHCELPLGEMSQKDVDQLKRRNWRRRVWRAKNVTYAAMTALVVGLIWWYVQEPVGWLLPPPVVPTLLIFLGTLAYAIARIRLFWLRLKRNRPD